MREIPKTTKTKPIKIYQKSKTKTKPIKIYQNSKTKTKSIKSKTCQIPL